MKRKAARKPRTKPRAKAARAKAPSPRAKATSPALRDADPLAGAALRPLLERYCELAGVKRAARSADHVELSLPPRERPFFRDRERVSVAFSLDALEREPEAEIAVPGSPFLTQVVEAIRARGARLSLGLIAPLGAPARHLGEGGGAEPGIPVRNGKVKRRTTRLAVHPVGRLTARIVLRAGAGVEEAVVETDVYDLSAGAPVAADVAAAFRELEAGRLEAADPAAVAAAAVPARKPDELLQLLVSHLREQAAERVAGRRATAERELAAELARLDRYFESVLAEQANPEAIATVSALAARRRAEEIRRSQVKAVVHPLQLVEAAVLMQRAEWQLESEGKGEAAHRATFAAQRSLSGTAGWSLACPHCGRPPSALVVCRHDHCGCEACSHRCSVCGEDFCTDHGIVECRVDGQPACDAHVQVCPSCRLEHCSEHAGECAEDGHAACSACLAPCASCGREVCNRHAQESHADAPKGSRRLCAACLRYCEGGTNEPVGVDEVAPCASCGKSVCTAHQAVCAVDEQVHCSLHLRRVDRSRRLVCARHRAACAEEPAALFASDEVAACPICGRTTCELHRATCDHCGRVVCSAELGGESQRCATCTQLAVVSEPPEAVVSAALAAEGSGAAGKPQTARRWRMARDRSHVVVEVDLGNARTAVVTLRPEDNVPDRVVHHP